MLSFLKRRVAVRPSVTAADTLASIARRLKDPALSREQRVALKFIAYHLAPVTPVTPWSEAARRTHV